MTTFSTTVIQANLVDIFQRKTYPASINIQDGMITRITPLDTLQPHYILPGFIDAHVHIESSMLTPAAFARLAVAHGTIATVSDPHEIANVCGVSGVRYMIENSKKTPFKFFFGAPSCVPATNFETAGAVMDAVAIEKLLAEKDIWYLAEMMNYPGVWQQDPEVMAKIAAAKKAGKPVDGHAPGVKGRLAAQYAAAGISTDHESFTLEEALDKIRCGMYCIIREGSAAKNFEALSPLITLHPDKVMFCSDDKHPDELVMHHINRQVVRAVAKGYDLYDVLRAACINPVFHYGIPVGMLREGDPADFILVEDLHTFSLLETRINGQLVADKNGSILPDIAAEAINNFHALPRMPTDFQLKATSENPDINIIEAMEGQLVTNRITLPGKVENGLLVSDPERDILKIAVINRYVPMAAPAIAFIRNFGLKKGALASTVGHDCHNIIAVGVDDTTITAAVNALIAAKGGIAVAEHEQQVTCFPLPIAGLMSTADGYTVATEYAAIDQQAKSLGTKLQAPFMTLSFMALLVIPSLKLSDKGLFDGNIFQFIPVEDGDTNPA